MGFFTATKKKKNFHKDDVDLLDEDEEDDEDNDFSELLEYLELGKHYAVLYWNSAYLELKELEFLYDKGYELISSNENVYFFKIKKTVEE